MLRFNFVDQMPRPAALLLFLTLTSTALTSGAALATPKRPDAAPAVLAAFQGSCGSQGVFTQSAQSQSTALINILQNLKATDACKGFAGQLGNIQTALSQIQSLQQTPSYATYQADLQNYQLLTLALQNAPAGSAQAQSLSTALLSAQTQMYADQATYNVSTQTSQRSLNVSQASAMLTWGQQLTTGSSTSSLSQCLMQSPGAALELGSNLAAMGGSFIPGMFGTGVSVIAQLMNTGIEVFRQGSYDRAIFKAQRTQMPDAISCALESMSETYCHANDSYALLDLARRNRLANYAAAPLWLGIDIQSRQLPALTAWLQQIQNEVPPQDSYQAARQNAVLTEMGQLQQQNNNVTAAINVAIAQAKLATTPSTQLATIVNMIANVALQIIAPQISGSSTSSSFSFSPTLFTVYQSSPYVWACLFVNGPNATNCPQPLAQDINGSGTPTTAQLSDYISTTLGVTTAQVIPLEATMLNTWQTLLPRVQVLVSADFARVLATNAGTILATARVKSGGAPLSPIQVLQNILAFFDQMTPITLENPQLATVLALEKHRIEETIHQLSKPDSEVCLPVPATRQTGTTLTLVPMTAEQCLNNRLVTIFNLFELQNGTQVFTTDMSNLVNIDLQYKLANHAIPTDTLRILQASGQDMSVALQTAGLGDLDPIADDLASARADIESNIQIFREFFVDAFTDAVKHESEMAFGEHAEAGPNRPHGQRLGELCMLWMLTSHIRSSKHYTYQNWPKGAQQACMQTLYFNGNDSPEASRRFAPAFKMDELANRLAELPFAERACVFHNYKVANRAKTLYIENYSKH